MKFRLKSLLVMGLVICLAFSFGMYGCSSSADKADNKEVEGKTKDVKGEEQIISKVKFKLFTDDGSLMQNLWGKDPVSKILEEKTGVQFEVIGPSGDTHEKLNLMLNTGDIPDFIHIWQGDSLIPSMIDAGILLSIDDLAKKYNAQNILTQIAKDEKVVYQFHRYANGEFYQPSGKLYYLSNYQLSKDYYDIIAADEIGAGTTMVRKSVWEKMGKPAMNTPDTFYNTLKRVKDEGYKDNRGKEMIPLFLGNNAIRWDQGSIAGSFGITWPYYVAKNSLVDPVVTHTIKHPRYLEMTKYTNKLWKEGLIEPESFSIKTEQSNEKLKAGNYFCVPWAWYMLREANAELMKEDPNDMYIGVEMMKADGVTVPLGTAVMPLGRSGWMATMITNKCHNPERAIQFLDYLMTREGQMLVTFGPDGLGYKYDSEGKVTMLPEAKAEYDRDAVSWHLKTGIKVWYFVNLMQYHREGNNPIAFSNPEESVSTDQKLNAEVTNKAKVFFPYTWADINPMPGDPLVTLKGNIDQIYNNARPKMLKAASEDELETIYYETIKEMEKAGLDRLEAYWAERFIKVNKLYQEGIKELKWFKPTEGY